MQQEVSSKKNIIPVIVILGLWLLANLLQASFTCLFDDEALFWLYGMRLSWGFYEHPPMVGLLIRAGYGILHNELGVRLFFILGSTLSVFLLMRLSEVKDYLLFAFVCFSSLIMHIGGFIAAPDLPLMLLILLFFLIYRKYLEHDSPWIAIAWGVIMAAMVYSKYHSGLIILLTLLSNLRLFTKRSFYLATLTAILLFIPHVLWSFRNDHPSLYYHLFERNIESYRYLQYFIDFILGQILLYGPFISFFIFWFAFTRKSADLFEKSLKFCSVGILLFFMLYNFRDRVEANWTLPGFIPMFILAYRSIEKRVRLRRTLLWIGGFSIFLFLFVRVYLVYDFLGLPRKTVNLSELYYWKDLAKELKQKAGGRPVAILNSYQRTAKYSFYAGEPACGLDEWDSHRTQFWYWKDLEQNLQGKDILLVHFMPWVTLPGESEFMAKNGINTHYVRVDSFRSYYRVPVKILEKELRFPAGQRIAIPVRIFNPDGKTLSFGGDKTWSSLLTYHILSEGKFVAQQEPSTDISFMTIRGAYADTTVTITTPAKPGEYIFWVSIRTGWLPSGRNDHPHSMKIY